MKILSSIRELHTQYKNWLGATPIKSSSLDEEDEEFIKQYFSAKDGKEAEVILEKHFDKMLEDMPTEFSEDELVAEEDLPHWLRENAEEALSKPLPELKIEDDVWLEDDKKPVHPILIIFAIIIFSVLGILGIGFFGENVLWAIIPVIVVGVTAGQVVIIRQRKSINQSWQGFAEQHGLDYEINKDTRRLVGQYQGYTISVDTHNIGVRGTELRTNIMLFDLRMSPGMFIRISPYGIFDKVRKLLGEQERSAKGELEKYCKIIAEPKHLAYVISSSTKLCERLLKIEADKAEIEIGENILLFEQSTPPDKVENWQFLLNTLCILARQIERADS
jgi:hypothetical protein